MHALIELAEIFANDDWIEERKAIRAAYAATKRKLLAQREAYEKAWREQAALFRQGKAENPEAKFHEIEAAWFAADEAAYEAFSKAMVAAE